jgi:hypothetical protein
VSKVEEKEGIGTEFEVAKGSHRLIEMLIVKKLLLHSSAYEMWIQRHVYCGVSAAYGI